MRPDLVRGHLEMLVLSIVSSGATYGYAIAEELRGRSDGQVDLQEGTLYPALYRLEATGLLASTWTEAFGRRRRVYRLTRRGRRVLEIRTREWTEFTQAVARIMGGRAWADPVR